VRAFGGSDRFVVDYLTDEVLGSVDDEARSFLLSASVLRRFTPELCDGVLERNDSAAMAAKLERRNMFISRLEHGGWYRVHSLFAEFAGSQLESSEPGALAAIHGRAAAWLRGHGFLVEATEHAAAAGDHEVVAQILTEHHLTWLRAGRARSLLRWVSTLPGEKLVEHPALAAAAATAALITGRSTLLQRRYLRLVDRARSRHPERVDPYVEATVEMVRAASLEGGVGEAVAAGRRAVELAESEADEVSVAALAGLARALFFAGELDEAWAAALRAVEHPQAEVRTGGQAVARVTLTLVAVERQRIRAARTHAEKARALVGGIGFSRSWLGANASLALGVVLAEEGALAAAERELAYAGHFFQDEVATVHHAWLLAVLAGIRCRRGRLDEAKAALRSAREEIAELADPGMVPMTIAGVERALGEAASRASAGELLEPPSPAELTVLRLLVSDLTVREIGRTLFLSPNTIRSHTRALYRKLGASSRAEAVARAGALGLIEETESPM
jgi:LuxR family maltose regulon positive regulatory protein